MLRLQRENIPPPALKALIKTFRRVLRAVMLIIPIIRLKVFFGQKIIQGLLSQVIRKAILSLLHGKTAKQRKRFIRKTALKMK